MDEISVKNVTEWNVDDLCWVCVPPDMRDDADWIRGAADKKKWAAEMLRKWGPFAKVAYQDGNPAGMIQYRPSPEERIVSIDCIYVPVQSCWGKGMGSRLLSSLLEDMKKPISWFDNGRPFGLVTTTFPGGAPEQYTAREFFSKKGFRQIGEGPDYLYYPLQPGFVYWPAAKKEVKYIPQGEDKGRVLIISGPDYCPATYPYFLKRMEKYVREMYPEVPIRWIDSSEEPEDLRKRNIGIGTCIVNARLIRSYVTDKDTFQKEVRAALR